MMVITACSIEKEEPFRVGTNIWPGYELLYLARELEHFADSNIKLIELPNATDVIQALRNEVLEAATLTLDEALTILQDDHRLQVILVMDFSRGGDALLAIPDIKALEDLRGRRIGVENTAVGAILLDAALGQARLSLNDVELVSMTVDRHVDAYESGSLDAVVTFEPSRSKILALGATSLFDSTSIPDRIVDVLVVRPAVAEQHEDSLRLLLSGYFMALQYMQTNPQEAAQLLSQRIGLRPDEILKIYQGLHQPKLRENYELLGINKIGKLQRSVESLVELMLAREMLYRNPDIEGLLNGRWLPQH